MKTVTSIAPLPRPRQPMVGVRYAAGREICFATVAGIYIEGDRRAVETAVRAQEVLA